MTFPWTWSRRRAPWSSWSANTSARAGSSGTTCSRRRSARSRCWNAWAMPEVEAPEAEAPAGSDYGNPDPEWMRIDWREHLRRVKLPGSEVNYVEMGEGEPIVFVHGLSGCWQNWLENLPHFARDHRVIALDPPRFGGSPLPRRAVAICAPPR